MMNVPAPGPKKPSYAPRTTAMAAIQSPAVLPMGAAPSRGRIRPDAIRSAATMSKSITMGRSTPGLR